MLKMRVLGAVVGLPLLFLVIGLNWFLRAQGSHDSLPLLCIVLIIAGAAGLEVGKIIAHHHAPISPLNGLYAALILPLLVHAVSPLALGDAMVPTGSLGFFVDSIGLTLAVMLLFLGIWGDVEREGRVALKGNLYILLAGLYIGGAMSTLLLLGLSAFHEAGVVFVFVSVFALDTFAYFGGKRFGGTRLAPHISPNKTISGALCGLLATVVLVLIMRGASLAWEGSAQGPMALWQQLSAQLAWWQLAVIGVGVGIFGQVGDLMESAFKRWGGVKDSGGLIPGHGGFLDRFDSLFLAAPVCYLLLMAFLRNGY